MKATHVLGAATNVGIRPYEQSGLPRRVNHAPAAYRTMGLLSRMDCVDEGDLWSDPYVDYDRTPGAVRNEAEVLRYTRRLDVRVASLVSAGRFVLVAGGDCSTVLGCLLGSAHSAERIGLVYVDAHDDFHTPAESGTGSAAGMCLGLAVGRGDSPLARLRDGRPAIDARDVVLAGHRDYSRAAQRPADLGMIEIPGSHIGRDGPERAGARALAHMLERGVDRFWVHVDADVLDPDEMPAVDSPEPGGLRVEELARLVRPLARHSACVGMNLTIYDPHLDDREFSCGRLLVKFLGDVLVDTPS